MKSIYKDVLKVLTTREKKKFFWLVFLNTLVSLIDIFSIIILLVVIGIYTTGVGPMDEYPLVRSFGLMGDHLLPAFFLLFLFIIKNVIGGLVFRWQSRFIVGVATRISEDNLIGYLFGPYTEFTDKESSLYIREMIHTPTEFAQYVLLNAQLIITETMLVSISVMVLLIFKTKLFFILLITLLPAVLILSFITRKRLRQIKANIKSVAERSLHYVRESIDGFIESNLYQKNHYFIRRHHQIQKSLGKFIADMQFIQNLSVRFFEVFAIIGLFILLIINKMTKVQDPEFIIIINAFMAAAYKIIPGTAKIVNFHNQLKSYLYSLTQIKSPLPPMEEGPTEKLHLYSITVNNLSFSYHGKSVLNQFSIKFLPGALTGVFGRSGKGKSTLFHLLLGLYEPAKGQVLINGRTLDAGNKREFWQKISYVKQSVYLMHASILDNIVLFEKDYNEHRLQTALAISGLLEQFPEGVSKMIIEGGKNISGGQRQRIVLARALYKDFDLLLLDEPFSEIDGVSAGRMLSELRRLAEKGKMILFISHDRNAFNYCHYVLDLDKCAGVQTIS